MSNQTQPQEADVEVGRVHFDDHWWALFRSPDGAVTAYRPLSEAEAVALAETGHDLSWVDHE